MFGAFKNVKFLPLMFLLAIIGFIYYSISSRNATLLQRKKKFQVITTLPVTYSLASFLAQGTSIEPDYLPIPLAGAAQAAYFQSNHQQLRKRFERLAAVITLRRLFSDDHLYAYARHYNVRLIEIDASGYAGSEARTVATQLSPLTTAPAPSVWHSVNRTIEMAEIISADFERIVPIYKRQIRSNLRVLKKQLLASQTDIANRYAGVADLQVVATTDAFLYLTEESSIFVSDYVSPSADDVSAKVIAACEASKVRVVLADQRFPAAATRAIEAAGLTVVVLDRIAMMPVVDAKFYFSRIGDNHSKLLDAFTPTP